VKGVLLMGESVIKIDNLVKSYGQHEVLKGINMSVNKGDIYGVIGKNGAGKTTLFKVILGLSPSNSGNMSILGAGNEKDNNVNRAKIGFFVGVDFYNYLSGAENLHYYRRLKGIKEKDEVERVLEIVGLNSDAAKIPVKKYSLGMKQRLGIANALLGNPEILIFDEPTNGLDPQGIMDVRNMIQKINEEEGTTIIVSSHILSELQNTAHRFGMLYNGVVIKELDQEDLRVRANVTSINVADDDLEKAMDALKAAGVDVKGTEQAMNSLENYYFSLIGGGDNA
jgi:ABC-type multidrug transport system ATPase subunit